ncbi:MAG: hypothetical protein IJQ70_08750, partial [Synergistaceae bacterium]|nr:hypothetical protein [Synergistaceae bacterium]
LDEYDELQRKLLGSSWSLLRQYQLPDSYRLTQNALMKFSSAMKEAEPSKRQRMMKYLEGDFAMYAPYWFYRAKAANEAGSDDEAGKYFERFEEVWRPVLRKDPYRAEAMKFRIERLMVTRDNTAEILKCLSEMRANTELEDWANNIFAGMVYFTLGDKEKAEECVMCNVDFGFECEVSGKVLEYMTTGKLPPENPDTIPVKSPEPPKVEPPKPKPEPQKVEPPKPKPEPQKVEPPKQLVGKGTKSTYTEAQYRLGLIFDKISGAMTLFLGICMLIILIWVFWKILRSAPLSSWWIDILLAGGLLIGYVLIGICFG